MRCRGGLREAGAGPPGTARELGGVRPPSIFFSTALSHHAHHPLTETRLLLWSQFTCSVCTCHV
eukprot:COSAG04_NODE_2712_length_3696_cov_54.879344_4_plen_64_part_00